MKKPLIKFVKTSEFAELPKYQTPGAAGLDLKTVENFTLHPGQRKLVSTGLRIKVEDGFMGFVMSRSGLANKDGVFVLNAPGLVDCDYTGALGVILLNSSDEDKTYSVGDRIAQLVVLPVEQVECLEVDELEETVRGQGGFGSTGTK